jgi:hypothetical protein
MKERMQVEHWYTVSSAAERLDMHPKTVIEKLLGGAFGDRVTDLAPPTPDGKRKKPNYRIPASGINAYLAARRLFPEATSPMGVNDPDDSIPARSLGELRRKAQQIERQIHED